MFYEVGDTCYVLSEKRIVLTNMNDMFCNLHGCPLVTSIEFENFDTAQCSDMYGVFWRQYDLEYVDLSGWDLSSCTNIDELFMHNHSLKRVDGISDWDLSRISNLSAMFYDCWSLEELDLSGWKLGSGAYVTSMFSGCRI